jgi:hypothetical protein
MNLHFWNSSISLNEGTTELILENNSLRHSSNLGHFKMKCLHSLSIKLEDRYINHWKNLLLNDDNKNGGNKLRTYRKLKNSYKMEKFLHSDVDKFA